MWSVVAPVHLSQSRSADAMNSGQLSLLKCFGTPRTWNNSASTSTTSSARRLRATASAKHSRVYSSTNDNYFSVRPFSVRSKMKSQAHT